MQGSGRIRRRRLERRLAGFPCGQRLPPDRQAGGIHRDHRVLVPDQQKHRLAAKSHLAVGEHRLVPQFRKDREAVVGNVGRGGDRLDARVEQAEGSQVAQGKAGAGMRRADGPHPQGSGRIPVGAEVLGPGDLGRPIEPVHPGADRLQAGRQGVRIDR